MTSLFNSLPVLALLITGVLNFSFGVYVLFRRRNLESFFFFMLSFGTAGWALAMGIIMGQFTQSQMFNFVLDRLTYACSIIAIVGMLFYVVSLQTENFWQDFKNNKMLWLLSAMALINLALVPTNLISNNPGTAEMSVGPLMIFLAFFLVLTTLYILYYCYRGWQRFEGRLKARFAYIGIVWFLLVAIALVFNVCLPILGITSYPAIGAVSSILVVFMIGLLGLGTLGFYITGALFGTLGMMVGVSSIILLGLGIFFVLVYLLVSSLLQKL